MFVDPARPGPARSAACQARLIIPPMPPVRRALPEPDTRCDQRAAAPPPRVSETERGSGGDPAGEVVCEERPVGWDGVRARRASVPAASHCRGRPAVAPGGLGRVRRVAAPESRHLHPRPGSGARLLPAPCMRRRRLVTHRTPRAARRPAQGLYSKGRGEGVIGWGLPAQ